MNEREESVSAQKGIKYTKSEDFAEVYANNTQLFSSAWDLKVMFGELDQSQGPNAVVQHTSVVLPWPQAKLLLFFLSIHVTGYEADYGHIALPKDVIPEFPKEVPPEASEKTWKVLKKMYDEFLTANPELRK